MLSISELILKRAKKKCREKHFWKSLKVGLPDLLEIIIGIMVVTIEEEIIGEMIVEEMIVKRIPIKTNE